MAETEKIQLTTALEDFVAQIVNSLSSAKSMSVNGIEVVMVSKDLVDWIVAEHQRYVDVIDASKVVV